MLTLEHPRMRDYGYNSGEGGRVQQWCCLSCPIMSIVCNNLWTCTEYTPSNPQQHSVRSLLIARAAADSIDSGNSTAGHAYAPSTSFNTLSPFPLHITASSARVTCPNIRSTPARYLQTIVLESQNLRPWSCSQPISKQWF